MAKPGLSPEQWAEVQEKWQAGELSMRELARQYGITAAAISARFKRRGVKRKSVNTRQMRQQRQLALQGDPKSRRIEILGKRTPENLATIIEAIESGATQQTAAGVCGISEETIRRWRADDPDVDNLLHSAVNRRDVRREHRIDQAGEQDWKAHSWLLERQNEGYRGSRDGNIGPAVIVNVNIPNPDTTIDITPTESDT